ncbi:DUF2254 domain-containing protein [Nocardioides acrostichi]|uniref:DUF2254 domain-containing protein n=1 Tax=Nocardioides acrostichi TaxID=2784339 RepID=A0A930Y5R0_9ACTN|nr:DUF2254 domain-containing protein [Nocardioides acrostichi]MBF4160147.1 DUF2254 domain-containing protein [Nocardioides acrostichi]
MSTRARRTPTPLTGVEPAISPLARWWHRVTGPFWVVPVTWCVAVGVVGLAMPRLETAGLSDHLFFLFPSDVEGARSVLGAIASAMISVTGLVFSNTMVVLQLASSQYSPRVLRSFLDDRVTQHTLGLFTGSFVYALTLMRSLGGGNGDPVPQVGLVLAYLLVLAAVGMFLAFIHHITQAVGVTNVLQRTANETRDLLARTQDEARPSPASEAWDDDAAPSIRPHVVVADHSGYLDLVDVHHLVRVAHRHEGRVDVLHPLGTFVVEGSPVALVHAPELEAEARDQVDRSVCSALELAQERTLRQDVSFGLRRLVDIAERALSPGVNDPTTAVQAIDQLHDLLRRMAVVDPTSPHLHDEDGVLRLVTRPFSFGDYLDLAVDEVAHWGRDSIQIPRRLTAMLDELEAAAIPAHRDAVRAKQVELARDERGGAVS